MDVRRDFMWDTTKRIMYSSSMRCLQRSRSVGVLSKQTQETPFPSIGKRSFLVGHEIFEKERIR